MKSSIKTINREICPHCGQTINRREITPTKIMVKALIEILTYCKTNKKTKFTREEIRPYILHMGSETITATFGNWIYFGAGMIFKEGKGNWGLNIERVEKFLKGDWIIPLKVAKKGKSNDIEVLESGTVWKIKGVQELMTPEGQFPIFYRQ